ncbi:hypothetical protein FRC11_006221 [Ceratobasidium sp. 423]|nr:hypothetical protein FRC11_006221 [Ceratobasidium sp. 423]
MVVTYIYLQSTTYTPPTLPVHVSIQLEPVTGAPSEEGIIRVQDAIRLYQQFLNAKYAQRVRYNQANPVSRTLAPTASTRTTEQTVYVTVADEERMATNNPGKGADVVGLNQSEQRTLEGKIHDAIERSNRLAEQANQLIERSNQLAERSNQIAERANQLVGRSNQPVEQSNTLVERFGELFERLNQHLEEPNKHHERSNSLSEELVKPVEKLEDVLENINRVLVKIQHAIVRNHKGNGLSALDCLTNEKGETPGMSATTRKINFNWTSQLYSGSSENRLPFMISGVAQDAYITDQYLGQFLSFYGIGGGLCEDATSAKLLDGMRAEARGRLSDHWSSCLG